MGTSEELHTTWTIDEFDVMVMSWVVATLLLGPDDGSIERDEIEVQIQGFIVASFAASDRPEKGELPPIPPESGSNGEPLIPWATGELLAAARREFHTSTTRRSRAGVASLLVMEETYTDYLGRLWDFSTDPPIHGDSGSLLRKGGCAGPAGPHVLRVHLLAS